MIIGLVLLSGMLLAGGLSCLLIAFARFTPRLEAAVERIGADGATPQPAGDVGSGQQSIRTARRLAVPRCADPAIPWAASGVTAAGQIHRGVLCRQSRDGDRRRAAPRTSRRRVRVPHRSSQRDPGSRRCYWWSNRLLRA